MIKFIRKSICNKLNETRKHLFYSEDDYKLNMKKAMMLSSCCFYEVTKFSWDSKKNNRSSRTGGIGMTQLIRQL